MTRPARVTFWMLLLAALAGGAYVRAWNLTDKLFWRDEAWVASLVERTPWGALLLQTDLPTPPLFAVSAKLTGQLVGPPEVGLRLLPLVCGLALLPLAYLAARALRLPRSMALTGLALCAGSFLLANWSRELKQYQPEALVSTLGALLAFRFWRRGPRAGWAELGGLALLCLIGPWLGYGTVFVLGPLAAGLALRRGPAPGRPRRFWSPAACLLVLGASFLTVMAVAGHRQGSEPALRGFVRPWFIQPLSPRSWGRAGVCGVSTTSAMVRPPHWLIAAGEQAGLNELIVTTGVTAGLWALVLAGLRVCPRRCRGPMVAWVLGPWVLMLAAAAAQQYPFGMARMMTVLAPGTLLAAGAGLAACLRWLTLMVAGRPAAGLWAAAALALAPLVIVAELPSNRRHWIRHDFPAVLAAMDKRRRPDEPVLVDLQAAPVVQYYRKGRDAGFFYVPAAAGTVLDRNFDPDRLIAQAQAGRPERLWLITCNGAGADPQLPQVLGGRGWLQEQVAQAGGDPIYGAAQLYLVRPPARRP